MLAEGDRRSVGRVDEVVALAERNLDTVETLVALLWHDDARIRLRAADALEKISRQYANALQRYKPALIALLQESAQQEVRWHLAVLLPRLKLTISECDEIAEMLQAYLNDKSSIVKTCAMQGLFDLLRQRPQLRQTVVDLLDNLSRTGTAAMKARGRKLMLLLAKRSDERDDI